MSNEELVVLIVRIDPDAKNWVYNWYCGNCARFLYSDDLQNGKCKKCNTTSEEAISRALPFLTSATAIEKLLIWLKSWQMPVLSKVLDITNQWFSTDMNAVTYKQQIVDCVGEALATHLRNSRL